MNLNCVIDGALLTKYPPVITQGDLFPLAKNLKRDFFKEEMVKAVRSSINEDLCIVITFPSLLNEWQNLGTTSEPNVQDAIDYLDHLILEIVSKAELFRHYKINELRLRGTLCSLLPVTQIVRLTHTIADYFDLQGSCKKVIELMLKKFNVESFNTLKQAGFSHIDVLISGDNVSPILNSENLRWLLQTTSIFDYVNINLLLPPNYSETDRTLTLNSLLEQLVEISPDQITIKHDSTLPLETCAVQHPHRSRNQLVTSTRILTDMGYYLLAPGYFVKPDSAFARAQQDKTLKLNIDGFTLQEHCDVLGIGAGAVSVIANMFSQNVLEVDQYNEMLGNFGDAMEFGCVMNEDELLRRHVVKELLCNLYLDKTLIEQTFDIQFDQYFAAEIIKLDCLIQDELVLNTDYCLSITPAARLLIKNVCHVFEP